MEILAAVAMMAMNTYLDLKKREISLGLTALMGICGLWKQWQAGITGETLLPLFFGIAFLCISIWSKGNVGFGDGLQVLVLGLWMDFSSLALLLVLALLLISVFGLWRRKKRDRQRPLPFVPFLFCSFLVLELISWLEV